VTPLIYVSVGVVVAAARKSRPSLNVPLAETSLPVVEVGFTTFQLIVAACAGPATTKAVSRAMAAWTSRCTFDLRSLVLFMFRAMSMRRDAPRQQETTNFYRPTSFVHPDKLLRFWTRPVFWPGNPRGGKGS
jgi:hypothetical protein